MEFHLFYYRSRLTQFLYTKKMLKKITVFATYLFLVILYLLANSTPLTGAELANIVIRNSASKLLIDIKLKGVFTGEMKEALSKGIPIDIAFSVALYEVHDFWFDNKMISQTANHQIRIDIQSNSLLARISSKSR